MKKIYISKTFLPPLSEYEKYLKQLWKTHVLTGQDGPLVTKLEERLKKYWGVRNVVCVSNGTTALLLLLKAYGIKELQLSANSFVATGAAPTFLGIKTHWLDMGTDYSPKLPTLITHLYGIPHYGRGEPLIYDASHAFTNKPLFQLGDASIISFSAVKIFQTGEGGAVVTKHDDLAQKILEMRCYGQKERGVYGNLGINGKMSELHAAMGLTALPHVAKVRSRLDSIIKYYDGEFGFAHTPGLLYYPVYLRDHKVVQEAIKDFESNGIYPRRYLYPPLNKVYGGRSCPVFEDLMSRVLALPLHYYLTEPDIKRIIKIAKRHL